MAKNVSDVVMGMLSDVGSTTRAAAPIAPAADPPAPAAPDLAPPALPRKATAATAAPAVARPDQAATSAADTAAAPRTLRLRTEAAAKLRAAWLEAKRDDVLLTAQDFASDLVLEALVSRRRRRAQTSA